MSDTKKTAAEIMRERLLAAKEKRTGGGAPKTPMGDNASFPFWNLKTNETATLRFLPDADGDNPFFWMPREVIKLPFSGVVGGEYPTNGPVTVTVPCVDMFGEKCPVIEHIRPWWKDESKKEMARTYYKKKSYIFQGFVTQSQLEETPPENPIRRFVMGPMLFEIIEKALMDPEMEDLPTDYVGGCDFKITKTQKGEFANYSNSSYARKSRPLSENEQIAIQQFGLWNLKDFLGRKPDADENAAIKAMFHDSLDGNPFDADAYGKYYRAWGGRNKGGDDDAVSQVTAPSTPRGGARAAASADVERDESVVAPATGGKPQAAEILARLRERTQRDRT